MPLLLGQAEARGGPTADNLSMLAVRWQDTYSDGSSGGSSVISTRTMPRDTVTTKMDEFGRNPQSRTELTEAEIELAIEEIRSTIQKYK